MVPALKELAAKAFSDNIHKYNLDECEPLTADLATFLAEKFSRENLCLNRSIVLYLMKSNVRKVIGIKFLLIKDFERVYELKDIERLELDFLVENLTENCRDRTKKVGVRTVEVLKAFLSPESRLTLRSLEMNGTHMEFGTSWRRMSEITPNLTSLRIAGCKLKDSNFHDLCKALPHLIKLDISHTAVSSLEPIRKLKNLEVLNMNRVNIPRDYKIKNIFKLKKLRVLIMSNVTKRNVQQDNSFSLESYLDCKKFLPELRFIDLSFQNINHSMLEQLVKTHPKLETISLIETPLNKISPLEYSNVKILNQRSIEECWECAKFYFTDDCCRFGDFYNACCNEHLSSIFEGIKYYIKHDYESIPESFLHELVKDLLEVGRRFKGCPHILSYVAYVFGLLSAKENVFKFDDSEIKLIFESFLEWGNPNYQFHENHVKYVWKYSIDLSKWMILSCDSIIFPEEVICRVKELCQQVIHGLYRVIARNSREECVQTAYGCMLLDKCWRLIPNEDFISCSANGGPQILLFSCIRSNVNYFVQNPVHLFKVLAVLDRLIVHDEYEIKVTMLDIKTMMNYVTAFINNQENLTRVWDIVERFILKMRDDELHEFYKEPMSGMIKNLKLGVRRKVRIDIFVILCSQNDRDDPLEYTFRVADIVTDIFMNKWAEYEASTDHFDMDEFNDFLRNPNRRAQAMEAVANAEAEAEVDADHEEEPEAEVDENHEEEPAAEVDADHEAQLEAEVDVDERADGEPEIKRARLNPDN